MKDSGQVWSTGCQTEGELCDLSSFGYSTSAKEIWSVWQGFIKGQIRLGSQTLSQTRLFVPWMQRVDHSRQSVFIQQLSAVFTQQLSLPRLGAPNSVLCHPLGCPHLASMREDARWRIIGKVYRTPSWKWSKYFHPLPIKVELHLAPSSCAPRKREEADLSNNKPCSNSEMISFHVSNYSII